MASGYVVQCDTAWPNDYPAGVGLMLPGDTVYMWFPYGGVFIPGPPGPGALDIEQSYQNNPHIYFYPALAPPETSQAGYLNDYDAYASLVAFTNVHNDMDTVRDNAGMLNKPTTSITWHSVDDGSGGIDAGTSMDYSLGPIFDFDPIEPRTVVEVVGYTNTFWSDRNVGILVLTAGLTGGAVLVSLGAIGIGAVVVGASVIAAQNATIMYHHGVMGYLARNIATHGFRILP